MRPEDIDAENQGEDALTVEQQEALDDDNEPDREPEQPPPNLELPLIPPD